ncbi:MAG TPA: hypothetical protein VGM54_18755 [Chthoniobacter sp.]
MEVPPQSSTERCLSRLVSNVWFLLAFFLAGILGAVVGYRLRPGGAIVGLPLLAWLPFGVLLGLNESLKAFRRVRSAEIPMSAAVFPLVRWVVIGALLLYLAIALVRLHPPSRLLPPMPPWTLWVAWALIFLTSLFAGNQSVVRDKERKRQG